MSVFICRVYTVVSVFICSDLLVLIYFYLQSLHSSICIYLQRSFSVNLFLSTEFTYYYLQGLPILYSRVLSFCLKGLPSLFSFINIYYYLQYLLRLTLFIYAEFTSFGLFLSVRLN
jgi:hypothetical protein